MGSSEIPFSLSIKYKRKKVKGRKELQISLNYTIQGVSHAKNAKRKGTSPLEGKEKKEGDESYFSL